MTALVLALLLSAGQSPASVSSAGEREGWDVFLRAQSQAGLVRQSTVGTDGNVEYTPVPTVDLQLSPSVLGWTAINRVKLTGTYAPQLSLRAATGGSTLFGLHRLGGTATFGDEGHGGRYDVLGGVVAGTVDFSQADDTLKQPFGLSSSGGVLPLGSASFDSGGAWRLTRRWRASARVGAGLLTLPVVGDQGIPLPEGPVFDALLLTPDGAGTRSLLPQLAPQVRTAFAYALRPTATLSLESRLDATADTIGLGWVGTENALALTWQPARRYSVNARGGALLAWQPATLAGGGRGALWPTGQLGATARFPMVGADGLSFSAQLGVTPGYDPFLRLLSERLGLSLGVSFVPVRQLAISAQAGVFSRLVTLGRESRTVETNGPGGAFWGGLFAPELMEPGDRTRLGDDHVTSFSAGLTYFPLENIGVQAGAVASARMINPVWNAATFAPQATAYVAVLSGFGSGS